MLPPPAPVVVIHADYGGIVTDYAKRVHQYKDRHVTVRIDGDCMSSCTLLTGLPDKQICVSERTEFSFHQAFYPNRFDPEDTSNRAEDGTKLLMRGYPQRIRDWIAAHGGLTKDLLVLNGRDLFSLFRVCK